MVFQKGHKRIAWNKGIKMPQDFCNKVSKSKLGSKIPDNVKLKMSLAKLGKSKSQETRKRMSISKTGVHMPINIKNKISKTLTGRKLSEETKQKLRGRISPLKGLKLPNRSGENHFRYIKDRSLLKGGSGSEERRSVIYKDWRKRVCDRDGWKCKIQNEDCKGRLEVHHILSFTKYVDLKYDVNNGIALCHFHHPKVRKEEKRLAPVFQGLVSVSK